MRVSVASKCLAILLILTMSVACTTDQILADLNLALQIAGEIIPVVAQLSPADGAAMQKASTIATEGLVVIETAYKTYEASGATTDLAKLEVALDAFKQNLNAAIAAARITNPASIEKVTAWANLIYSVTDAIISAIPQAKIKGGAPKAMSKLTKTLPQPATLKAQWKVLQGK